MKKNVFFSRVCTVHTHPYPFNKLLTMVEASYVIFQAVSTMWPQVARQQYSANAAYFWEVIDPFLWKL